MKKVINIVFLLVVLIGVLIVFIASIIHYKYEKEKFHTITIQKENQELSKDELNSDGSMNVLSPLMENQEVDDIVSGVKIVRIPALDIEVPLYQGTDEETLKKGAGIFDVSCELGEVGNFSIAGHSSSYYTAIFNKVEKGIKYLDKIEVVREDGEVFTYYVTETKIVMPSNVGVLLDKGKKELTLVTCSMQGNTRFVVTAELLSDEELNQKINEKATIYKDVLLGIVKGYDNVGVLSYIYEGNKYEKTYTYRVKYKWQERYDKYKLQGNITSGNYGELKRYNIKFIGKEEL